MPTVAEWVGRGRQRILGLLDTEHALIWDEVEARIADPIRGYIEPHHLTTARQQLRSEGVIVEPAERTRGGRTIGVIHYADTNRRNTAIARAARRKRLLHARYLSWTTPSSRYPRGRIGPAAEIVAQETLRAAAPHGFRLVNPEHGSVNSLLGGPVPGGPLDNAAYYTGLDDRGFPRSPVLLPIEIKNTRHWIYTQHRELHQVLYKAACLKEMHPEIPVVPVLICRKRHFHTRQMGVELGCYVIETRRQPILPSDIEPDHLAEVRNELGYTGLTMELGVDESLLKAVQALPRYVEELADRWARTGRLLVEYYDTLRDPDLRGAERWDAAHEMRGAARDLGCANVWCSPETP